MRSGGELDLPTGTLYPALRRLEAAGYLAQRVEHGRRPEAAHLHADGGRRRALAAARRVADFSTSSTACSARLTVRDQGHPRCGWTASATLARMSVRRDLHRGLDAALVGPRASTPRPGPRGSRPPGRRHRRLPSRRLRPRRSRAAAVADFGTSTRSPRPSRPRWRSPRPAGPRGCCLRSCRSSRSCGTGRCAHDTPPPDSLVLRHPRQFVEVVGGADDRRRASCWSSPAASATAGSRAGRGIARLTGVRRARLERSRSECGALRWRR